MDAVTNDDSVDSVIPSPPVPTPIDSEQKPKRSFRVNRFVAVIIGLAVIAALFIGYVVYVSPFPLIVIPMKILGLKLGYNFYNDPRNLVYFLYPKEGKVVLEANGTEIWKNADENGNNAVAIIQPAKVPMPSNGCTELEKNTWECSDYATENNSSMTSYYKKIFDTLYMINYGTKSSGRLQHANVRDDIFFTRVLQSLLLSPIQAPVTGNVEFLGHKIKLRDGWNVQSRLLEVEDLYFNDVISHVDVINNEYTILLSGGWGTARAPCISDSFYSEDGKYIVHDKEMTISDDIYRLDIVGISNRQRYSTKKRNKSSYEFELCQGNTQGGDDHESGTNIGQIEYNIPENFDPKVLEEMDGIIKDLAKKSNETKAESTSVPIIKDLTQGSKIYTLPGLSFQYPEYLVPNSQGYLVSAKECSRGVDAIDCTPVIEVKTEKKTLEKEQSLLAYLKIRNDGKEIEGASYSPIQNEDFEIILESLPACLNICERYFIKTTDGNVYSLGQGYNPPEDANSSYILNDIISGLMYTDSTIENTLPGVPIYPNSKFVGARTLTSCVVAIHETMVMGYDKESAERMVGGHCDGTEYSFTYNGNMDDAIIWYEKDVSQSGYKLSGGAGAEGVNRFGQLSNGSTRYALSIQNGEYQIVKKDRVQ